MRAVGEEGKKGKEEVGDVNRVLDGDIDGFIKTYLMRKASGTLGQAVADDE